MTIRLQLAALILLAGCTKTDQQILNPPPADDSNVVLKWTTGPNMLTPRQELVPTVLGNEIFFAGGFDPQLEVSFRLEIYDARTRTWRRAASLPVQRHHHGMATAAGKIYVIGGYSGRTGWRVRGDVLAYDPAADTWQDLEPMLTPRGGHITVTLDGKIYAIGGESASANSVAINEVYDPATDRWQSLAPMQVIRNHLTAVALGSEIYVIGGRFFSSNANATLNVATVEAYSPATDTWTRKADLPQAQGGLAAAVLDGKIYAFGGEFFSNGGGVYDEMWEYDAAADSWSALPPMRTPRHGIGAVTVADTIFVIGGGDKVGFGVTGINEGFYLDQ